MCDSVKLQYPFTCIISGPSGSGKSTFCINFLQNLEILCTEKNVLPKRTLSNVLVETPRRTMSEIKEDGDVVQEMHDFRRKAYGELASSSLKSCFPKSSRMIIITESNDDKITIL